MDKIYIVVAETLGTDGDYFTEGEVCLTPQEAGEYATSVVAEICDEMGVEADPYEWEAEGDGWWIRVRVEEFNLSTLRPRILEREELRQSNINQ
jgi:hypothetical protein